MNDFIDESFNSLIKVTQLKSMKSSSCAKNSFKINLNDSDEESEKILRISKLSSSKF
jgi:hypothetical protein